MRRRVRHKKYIIGCKRASQVPQALGECAAASGNVLPRGRTLSKNEVFRQPDVSYNYDIHVFQLKLQFVCDQGNKLGIGGFSLGIRHGIAKETL